MRKLEKTNKVKTGKTDSSLGHERHTASCRTWAHKVLVQAPSDRFGFVWLVAVKYHSIIQGKARQGETTSRQI